MLKFKNGGCFRNEEGFERRKFYKQCFRNVEDLETMKFQQRGSFRNDDVLDTWKFLK